MSVEPIAGRTQVSHLIVDEVHERDVLTDFLLVLVRELLPRRRQPDGRGLTLILMSATLAADAFARYFGHCSSAGGGGGGGGTAVPMLHIPGFTYRVQDWFLEDLVEQSGYRHGGGGQRGSKNARHAGGGGGVGGGPPPKAAELGPGYSKATAVTVGALEAAAAAGANDGKVLDYALLQHCIEHICSGDAERASSGPPKSRGGGGAQLTKTPRPTDKNAQPAGDGVPTAAAAHVKVGAVLVFLPGMAEIRKLSDMLLHESPLLSDRKRFAVLPLHSALDGAAQVRGVCSQLHRHARTRRSTDRLN
jgi:HrpA-like RNA helicase